MVLEKILHCRDSARADSTKAIIEERRCMFIHQFLKLDKPLIDLDDPAPSEMSYKSYGESGSYI